MQDSTFVQPGVMARNRRRGWGIIVFALLLAGAIAGAAWIAWQSGWLRLDLKGLGTSTATEQATSAALPLVSASQQAANDAAVAGATAKLAALEQRLAELNQQALSASGQATHAEALLTAFATRRAIERGQPLGYLESQLRIRFGDSQPNAVDRVISAAGKPITLGLLTEDFEHLRPQLVGGPGSEGAWNWFWRQTGQLFVIRHDDAPSPMPADRAERVRSFLAGNRVDMAIIEVERMPGRDAATEWLAHARDYVMTQRALDQLEAAALVTPIQQQPQPIGQQPLGTPTPASPPLQGQTQPQGPAQGAAAGWGTTTG